MRAGNGRECGLTPGASPGSPGLAPGVSMWGPSDEPARPRPRPAGRRSRRARRDRGRRAARRARLPRRRGAAARHRPRRGMARAHRGRCNLAPRRRAKTPAIEPQDPPATAEAGIGCDLLRQQLADRGTWLALDPPGLAGRTLGSIAATATAGPLRQGFGPVRDHLLGVTFVTGDGRLVHSGGRVVKNVAGYDLTRLEAGAFGAFGVIVLIHLRLRALPRADQTLALEGSREDLTQVAEDIAAAGIQPAAHELMSPALARRE